MEGIHEALNVLRDTVSMSWANKHKQQLGVEMPFRAKEYDAASSNPVV